MLIRPLGPSLAFAIIASAFFASPARAAPTIALATGGENPTRTSPKNDAVARDRAHYTNGISFDDCEKDVTSTFALVATDVVPGGYVVQAWAGEGDCSQTANRLETSGTCQPVSEPVVLATSTLVSVRGRDLVKASLGQSSPTGSGGAVPLAPSPPDASVCRTRTSPIGTTMNLTFLVFTTAGGSDPAAVLTFAPTDTALDVVVDTVGPDAPSHAVVAPAPGGVSVSWTPTQQPDESGFVTLCATSPTCPSDALLDGADGRTVDAKYVCGKPLDVTTSTTVVDGLQPGTPQTVAVAGVDLVGNVGRLALAGCVAPEAAPEAANDGGAGTKNPNAPIQAGCACGVAPSAGGGAGALVFALGALGALGVARRRRTR